jgi:Transglycosylase SLT domain
MPYVHGTWLQGWKPIAHGASNQGLILARLFSMPSFLSGKRSRLITVAIAGTLTLGTAASAAAATLPSGSPPAQSTVMSGPQIVVGFEHVRFSLGERQYEYDAAAAKAAAAQEAAAKAKAAKAAAAQVAHANTMQHVTATPSGSPEQIAQLMLAEYGWSSSQFSCLYPLWYHESGWNPSAENPGSGAYGIPQSLPGSQMASAGADWQTNPATQIKWGLTYIQGRYGSPCGAWAHEEADNWY